MDEKEESNNLITLLINGYQIKCSKKSICELSPVADQYFNENPNSIEMEVNISAKGIQFDLIESILENSKFHVDSSNDLFLLEFANKLQIQPIEDMAANWELYELQKAEEFIFSIDASYYHLFKKFEDDQEDCLTIQKFIKKADIIGKETICRLIINACIARPNKISIYLDFIQFLKIELIFARILLNQMKYLHGIISIREDKIQVICFLARYFYEKGLIRKSQIPDIWQDMPPFFSDLSDRQNLNSEEDKEKYKKNAFEGINPDPISIILRNDDIESFQKVACLPTFDFNQTIKPSEFERCDFINSRPCSLLEFCAFFGSIKCFKFILLNEKSNNNFELIKYAIAGGNPEIIHICEQSGFLNFKETREIAIKFHHWNIFEWLCDNKCHSEKLNDLQNQDIYSYLNQCIRFSNFTTLSYLLLSKEVDLNFALLTAIDYDNLLLTKWLIKHKEKLNKEEISKQKSGFLYYATRNENIEILKFLLQQKEIDNINMKYKGKAPIFVAIETENFDVYKFLIEQKQINFNIKDFSGKKLIHISCEHKNTEILKDLLINRNDKIDINSFDKNNDTPLHLACGNGNIEIIDTLFKYCKQEIQLNIKNKKGKTPIMMGCLSKKINNRLNIIQQIYNFVKTEEKKIELINLKGPLNKTILHMACENKEIKIVRFLISLPGINVNAVDNDNRTALMSSIFYGFDDITKLLLNNHEIDIDICDNNNKTAYDIAVGRSLDNEIIQIFHSKTKK